MTDANKTISIAAADLQGRGVYRLVTSVLVPRPIGWISTIGKDGTPNLAPFSFFGGAASRPPHIFFSSSLRDGRQKDSLRNAEETGEFVFNVVDEVLAEAMNVTSSDWPYKVDEFKEAGLAMAPCVDVRVPRVAAAPVAIECKVTQMVPVECTTSVMVIGKVLRFHLREGLLRANGLVDAELLRPVGRLGGDEYATLGQVFSMVRPLDLREK